MSTPPSEPGKTQDEIAQEQLRKLRLEIDALEREQGLAVDTPGRRRRKLDLEVQALQWQNGLVYKLGQYATIVTILATVATICATGLGVYIAYNNFARDREHEAALKQKELAEKTDSQYRTELRELFKYPVEEGRTISEAVFLFRDLGDVIENGYKGDDAMRQRKGKEVGFLLTQLVRSPDFDLSKTRNVNFDSKALDNSTYYRDHLIQSPGDSRDILTKYKWALWKLHDSDKSYYEGFSVNPEDPTAFTVPHDPKTQDKFYQYVYLYQAYKKHVWLLGKAAEASPGDEQLQRYLGESFCWFYGATQNKSLTIGIFGGDADMVLWRWRQCP